MGSFKKYIQYNSIIRMLNKQLRIERYVYKKCEELGVGYRNDQLSNIKKRITRVDNIWLKHNCIN